MKEAWTIEILGRGGAGAQTGTILEERFPEDMNYAYDIGFKLISQTEDL